MIDKLKTFRTKVGQVCMPFLAPRSSHPICADGSHRAFGCAQILTTLDGSLESAGKERANRTAKRDEVLAAIEQTKKTLKERGPGSLMADGGRYDDMDIDVDRSNRRSISHPFIYSRARAP